MTPSHPTARPNAGLSGIELLCTLGPSSMNERTIRRLTELGVTLFRINLSHTALDNLAGVIATVQKFTDVPICLDTEGAQIRTGPVLSEKMVMQENAFFNIVKPGAPHGAEDISFYPEHVVDDLRVGDILSIDFNSVLAQVVDTGESRCTIRILNGGLIGRNKAVTLQRPIRLAPLTEKDRASIAYGKTVGIGHFALSFANRAEDLAEIRALTGRDAKIISKIECINGYNNLADIARRSDAILIDRGDLSREIPIEQIPPIQKQIIRTVKAIGSKVYVATNLLETMIASPTPTRAEVNDIFNTLSDGADGLVLAAETAIGINPVACANMVVKLVREFRRDDFPTETYALTDTSLLVPPHGGSLVSRIASESESEATAGLPRLAVSEDDLTDAEQIAIGTFSPLTGFMDRETLSSVLDGNALPSGVVWPLPVVLTVAEAEAAAVRGKDRVVLTAPGGAPHSILDIREIYEIEPDALAGRWFGTESDEHPGVRRLRTGGSFAIAGDVTLIRRLPHANSRYDMTPSQLRFIFAHKGWSRIVGFHTRNVAHRAHEFIQMQALERTHADGLFISPVVGRRKPGDFLAETVFDCYQALMRSGAYPEGRVLLGSFQTYPRYAGPREAVFTALCRKNMGCSHFIVGRDHTGVGNFYAPDASHALFDALGDIGIELVPFDTVGHDASADRYVEGSDVAGVQAISATLVRDLLTSGSPVPEWLARPAVVEALRSRAASGKSLFQDA